MKPEIDIDALARLARLSFSDAEKISLYEDVEQMLAFASRVCDAQTRESAEDIGAPSVSNVLREDVPQECLDRDILISAAQGVSNGYVTVPRAVLSEACDDE